MPTFDARKNFAISNVATAPSPATSGTSLVVTAADGAKFATPPFNAVVWPTGVQPLSSNAEIVRVTAISTDTFTITRTQESTSARTIIVGDQIMQSVTNKTLSDIETAIGSGGTTIYTNTYKIDQTPAAGTYGTLAGLVNSSNTVYTVSNGSYATGTLEVYLNGQLLSQASGADWSETTPASGTFTFVIAPPTGSIVTVGYMIASSGSLSKLSIATGTNASAGTGTLVGGTVTISTTAVTSSSLIFLQDTSSSITNVGTLTVSAKTAGTSFTVTSTMALDTSTFNWFIIN